MLSPSPSCEYTEAAGTNERPPGSGVDGVGRICSCNGAIADPLPVPSSPPGDSEPAGPEAARACTLAAFATVVDETFALDRGGDAVPATLAEARSLGFNRPAEQGGLESFALLFHVPPGTRVSQGIHGFTHPRFGRQEWFLVPIGPDAKGLRLEVIFNFV